MGGGLDAELRSTVVRVKQEAAEYGRDPASITFRYTIGVGRPNAALESISKSISVDGPVAVGHGGSPEETADEIVAFDAAGFDELAINFTGETGSEVMEQLDWVGREVMPLL